MTLSKILVAAALLITAQADAQSTSGALIIVPANGEVVRANDLAIATFGVEEQDKDKDVAALKVNQKMKQGVAILRAADPQAVLKTQGYYTYPIYPEPPKTLAGVAAPKPVVIGWRVGQYVQVKTVNLAALPKTAAAAQAILSLNSINFGLQPATLKQVDEARIAATYANLNERIGSIATAMGRTRADAVIDTVDFEGSGNYANRVDAQYSQNVTVFGRRARSDAEVAEPSFEPGETTLQMKVVGKVRFK